MSYFDFETTIAKEDKHIGYSLRKSSRTFTFSKIYLGLRCGLSGNPDSKLVTALDIFFKGEPLRWRYLSRK